MKNFDWTSLKRKIIIDAPLSQLYDAWTIPKEIERWFLSKARYSSFNSINRGMGERIQADDEYTWNWYLYPDTEKGRITKTNGKDHVQFTFAGNCLVDIHLSQYYGLVMVELIQSNIPTDDSSKLNIRLGCDFGWSFYLVNLKSVYEGGLDLRNKDERFKGLLNN